VKTSKEAKQLDQKWEQLLVECYQQRDENLGVAFERFDAF